MNRFFSIALFLFVVSCSKVEFLYDDDKINNPLYEKTKVSTSGVELSLINSYIPIFFGIYKEQFFDLQIRIEEKKTKISVETNQAASNLRYEIRFFYTLKSKKEDCVTYEKEIISNFSIIPKSGGYDYGTDSSLEKKYELAINENFNQFISIISDIDIKNCK